MTNNTPERVFKGDIYNYCSFITYDGRVGDSKQVVDDALEVNGNDSTSFDKDFASFSRAVGLKTYMRGGMSIATIAFGLALNQRIVESPVNPRTQQMVFTPETKEVAVDFIKSVASYIFAVDQLEQDPKQRNQSALWFQAQLPQFREAILIADTYGDAIAAKTARDAAITAFILMAPTPPEKQA